MDAIIRFVLDPVSVVTWASGIITFVIIIGILLPYIKPNPLKARMGYVSQHRRELRAKQLESLKQKSTIRKTQPDWLKLLMDKFKLKDIIAGEGIRQKLNQANWRGAKAFTTFVIARLTLPFIFAGLAFWVMFSSEKEISFSIEVAIIIASFLAGVFLPRVIIMNAIQRRQAAFQLSFPDALDLLIICVESGLSIEDAFGRVAQEISRTSPVLAEEFELTTAEISYLPDQKTAYENLASRTGLASVRAVVTALTQAQKYGTPLASALRIAAQENREQRMALAEKKAAALPAKLTVPMIVFFLPVLFLVILGPAIIQILSRL